MTKIMKNILLYSGALALSATFAMATCGTGKCDSAKMPAKMTKCESGKTTTKCQAGGKCNGDMNKSKAKCGGDMKKEMPPKPAPAKGKCGQGKCG